jgi:hypothetical protein
MISNLSRKEKSALKTLLCLSQNFKIQKTKSLNQLAREKNKKPDVIALESLFEWLEKDNKECEELLLSIL